MFLLYIVLRLSSSSNAMMIITMITICWSMQSGGFYRNALACVQRKPFDYFSIGPFSFFGGWGGRPMKKNISRFKQIKAIKAFLMKNWPWRICKKSGKKRKKLFVSEQGGGLKRQILYAANRPYITIKILRMISNITRHPSHTYHTP